MGFFGLNYGAGYMILSGFGVSRGLMRYGLTVLLGVAPLISPIPGGAGAAGLVAYHMLEERPAHRRLGHIYCTVADHDFLCSGCSGRHPAGVSTDALSPASSGAICWSCNIA